MEKSSSSTSRLHQILKQKKDEDQERFANQTRKALQEHAELLRQLSTAEAETLQKHIAALTAQLGKQIEACAKPLVSGLSEARQHAELLKQAAVKAWIRSAAIGLALVIGLTLGMFALTAYLSNHVRAKLEEAAEINRQITAQRQMLEQLHNRTGGFEIRNTPVGNFLVYPPGTDPDVRMWEIEGRRAIRLPDLSD